MAKKSIRFFNDREVRAVWDESLSKMTRDGIELVSVTNQFKFEAPDGKQRVSDAMDAGCVQTLAKHYPNNRASEFLDWFTYSDNTIDGQSKKKAYSLFESVLLDTLEPGSIKCLQQIHAFIFGGLYDFAGQIRTKNISKGGFTFANALHFPTILPNIEAMPETTFDEIADKYVEMNVAHPFMEGNGRSTRIWLDLMLRRSLKKCVDWSRIDKNAYLDAMRRSVADPVPIKSLLSGALTDMIDDRETFMKGIDYSYYYEQSE